MSNILPLFLLEYNVSVCTSQYLISHIFVLKKLPKTVKIWIFHFKYTDYGGSFLNWMWYSGKGN